MQAKVENLSKEIVFTPELRGFKKFNVDFVFPYAIMTLCLSGNGTALYDMREITHHKNDLAFILPGHIMRALSCSEDFTYARFIISPKIFEDFRYYTFTHDYDKFNYAPFCTLTDQQAKQLLAIVEQVMEIAGHTEDELPHRHQTLLAQLAVGYEFLNYFRREQEIKWAGSRNAVLFDRFCEQVVQHFRESKEIKYYAELLHLHPKYLNRVVRAVTHGLSPRTWIEQYVAAQAKREIAIHRTESLKEIAYRLGFFEPTSFYRYFKRATGMTAKAYKAMVLHD